jgi:hypothetical protein
LTIETPWGTPYLAEMSARHLRDLAPYQIFTKAMMGSRDEGGLVKMMRAAIPCHCLDCEDPEYTPPPATADITTTNASGKKWKPGVSVPMRSSAKPYVR